MREIRTSGSMSGEGKRGRLRRVPSPFLDSTEREGAPPTSLHPVQALRRTAGCATFPDRSEGATPSQGQESVFSGSSVFAGSSVLSGSSVFAVSSVLSGSSVFAEFSEELACLAAVGQSILFGGATEREEQSGVKKGFLRNEATILLILKGSPIGLVNFQRNFSH